MIISTARKKKTVTRRKVENGEERDGEREKETERACILESTLILHLVFKYETIKTETTL